MVFSALASLTWPQRYDLKPILSLHDLQNLDQSLNFVLRKQGLIDEEKVDSFNIPLYFPTAEELKAIIERNGCFSIERMDKLPDPPLMRLKPSPESVASQIRAVFEGVVKEHFGYDLVDKIFNFFATTFAENFIFDELIKEHNKVNLFVLLKRVIN